jgi:hypothetical protein
MIDQGDNGEQKKGNGPQLAVNPPPPMEKTPPMEKKVTDSEEKQPIAKEASVPTGKKSRGKEVTRIARLRDGTNVVRDQNGRYYTISVDTDITFVRNTASVSAKDMEKCFDWTELIDKMLPSREEMIDNIQASILKAGGTQPGAGNPNRYLALAFNMYKLEFEEN